MLYVRDSRSMCFDKEITEKIVGTVFWICLKSVWRLDAWFSMFQRSRLRNVLSGSKGVETHHSLGSSGIQVWPGSNVQVKKHWSLFVIAVTGPLKRRDCKRGDREAEFENLMDCLHQQIRIFTSGFGSLTHDNSRPKNPSSRKLWCTANDHDGVNIKESTHTIWRDRWLPPNASFAASATN